MARIFVESDFELLPSIPSNWTIQKNKRIYSKTKYIVGEEFDNYQLLSLTKEGIKEIEVDDNKGKRPNDYGTYQRVNKGDLILCLYDLDVSAVFVGYSDYDGIISPSYLNLSSTSQVYNKYSYYWFLMNFYDRRYKIFSKSIRYTINNDNFMSLSSPLPPLDEQILIAKFLDKKVDKINELIQVQEDAIAKFEEYKQSVITETVIEGLDKTIEKKESNLDFCKRIPENYNELRFKFLVNLSSGLSISKAEYIQEGLDYLHYGDIHSNSKSVLDLTIQELPKIPVKYKDKKISAYLSDGDLVFCDTSEDLEGAGKHLYVKKLEGKHVTSGSHTILAKSKSEYDSAFLSYLFRATPIKAEIESKVYGIKVFSLSQRILNDIRVILPSVKEQTKIVNYLDKKTEEIEQLIQIKKDKIEKLNEYKKSLIYEGVTGKIEVM